MSHKKYVLALDEGTTSVRAVLFDNRANVVYTAQHEFSQIYPQPGWVEQNAVEIYAAQYAVMTECIAGSGISPGEIAGIGITNQRETTVVWNKQTGKPIYHAIVWQCRRTADICRQLKKDGKEEYIRRTTGLIPDAYFSGTKIKWILDHVESARPMAENGDLLFGTIDTWLLWKLTEGKVHATDVTNASRTMLFDIHKGVWDDQILNWLEIPAAMLPEVKSSSEIFGTVNVMGAEIPICGIAGDQQSALFGQGCFTEGTAKNTYGTGCFLLEHTGNYPIVSKNGLITTMAATEKDKPFEYALEGSVFVGGAVIQWLRDGLGLIREYRDSEYFAGKVSDTGGVYIVPAFAGLGAPYWNMNVRGTITGLTRGTRAEHLIRAAVESVAFQTEDLLAAMAADSEKKITCLRVDGGGSANDLMMQLQADYSGIEVIRSANQEATAAGAAFLAGLAVGFFPDRQTILELCKNGDHFSSSIDPETRKTKLEGWHLAIAAAQATVKE